MKNELLLATALVICAGCASTTNEDYSLSEMHSLSSANADYLAARTRNAPLDPTRKINEQDCTTGVNLGAGNLRCK